MRVARARIWLGDPPDPWTAEYEMQLPEELQDWSLYGVEQGMLIYNGAEDGVN
jgi:hypothetical protein